jgi:hypothetical protein
VNKFLSSTGILLDNSEKKALQNNTNKTRMVGLRGLELLPTTQSLSNRSPGPLQIGQCELPKNPQKGLAISCKRSGTVGNSGRLGAL